MSSLRSKIIRRLTSRNLKSTIPFTQRRNAQILQAVHHHPHRFVRTLSSSEKVLEKYREKLQEKMKSEGVSSYTELRELYKGKIENIQKRDSVPPCPTPSPSASLHPSLSQLLNPPPVDNGPGALPKSSSYIPPPPPGIKSLSSFIDIQKILHHNPQEIELIWRARHINDAKSLCAAIPKETYLRMESNAKKYPMFILPLPRSGGFTEGPERKSGLEMHFLQWTFPHQDSTTVLFTTLATYKLHNEFALPHTTITHHLEIMDKKGLVLLQGAVVPDRGVSAEEARWLLLSLQKFYGASQEDEFGRRRLELLDKFTRGDASFRIEDVIDEVERY